MRIDLAYGDETKSVLVPSEVGARYISPTEAPALEDVDAALASAVAGPVAGPPLNDIVRRSSTVTVLVSDVTRSGGVKTLLPALVAYLRSLGLPDKGIRILVAGGTHRAMSKAEREFFKQAGMAGITVLEHNCDDAASVTALVLTSQGTPVRINRAVKEADLTILLSPVSYHYFAGFGGGRKLILPGCADRAAILHNHRLALAAGNPVTLNPACQPAVLDGNPVHEDMVEALAALDNVFGVNFFCDVRGDVSFVNAGDASEAHAAACEQFDSLYRCVVDKRPRIVVLGAGGSPYDINLLQAHKALKQASAVLAEQAHVLFHARCQEGVGSESLLNALSLARDDFLKSAINDYALNNQTAVSLVNLTRQFRVSMVTELDTDVLESAGIQRCENPETFVAAALEETGDNEIAVIPYGSQTLPWLKGSE